MMDDNSMDVDYDVPRTPPPSTFKDISQHSPTSPSLSLPRAQVDKYKRQMIAASRREDWPARLIIAGDDKEELQNVLISVLSALAWIVLSETALQKSVIVPAMDQATEFVQSLNDCEVEEWKNTVQNGDWVGLITHSKLQKPAEDLSVAGQAEEIGNILHNHKRLGEAYAQDFIGDSATDFIECLEQADVEQEGNEKKPLYAKAISVVQSSGTGKSRLLTEVGKHIFTLPICLRKSTDPGYPPGDKPVVKFFSTLPKNNDLSLTAHIAIACFLAAAHLTMLELLQGEQKKGLNGPQLLEYWHELMEPPTVRDRREAFFTKVVKRADSMKLMVTTDSSPIRAKDGKLIPSDFDPFAASLKIYKRSAEEATKNLGEFLSSVLPAKRISVMYFDEAHELGLHFWIFLRLVQHQQLSMKMWYTFMGTKSSISYYAPHPSKQLSLKLKMELARLLPPYIDLGFDQRVIALGRVVVSVRMGEMQTIEFLSRYGRPMWSAHLPEETPGEMIALASWKLRNGDEFRATDKDHVFAVLSQRLCLDPVIAASEAVELADRSVAHHMRLLTGFSTSSERFYTHSPSEPMLVMGSIDILHNRPDPERLRQVLSTLSHDLCSAGLVEKGVLGELGARTLILIARDFAAPRHSHSPDLLKPVPLLHFLDTLFGRDIFTCSDRVKFENAFGKAHVNFTHWIITRDSIPGKPNVQLLANLWARGGALQCSFAQESIDFLIPLYFGSVHPDSEFDPSRLSVLTWQIKYKAKGDKKAEAAIRPIGAPRDRHQPLPYLAVLMELGTESRYQDNKSKIKYATSKPHADGEFGNLCDVWDAAVKKLETYRKRKKHRKETLEQLKKVANDARLAMDSVNRYSLSVRGVSQDVYGILRDADIAKEFATLLSIIMPSPVDERSTRQHMRPLERLSAASSHTDWMSEYVVSNELASDDNTDDSEPDVTLRYE